MLEADLLGTLLLFVAGFGWAKPVPVDPRNFPDWRKGMLLVAAAGPLANVTALLLLGLPAKLDVRLPPGWVAELWQALLWINAVLAVFSLLPIPPLDGSRVLGAVLRGEPAVTYARLQPYGALLLLFLVVLGLLDPILRPPVTWLLRWATT
jgi:Zn-dependent protease